MDKIKETKQTEIETEEETEIQPRNVEEYQKKWDQILQDTAKQIDKIRGENFIPVTYAEEETDSYHRE